MVPIRAARPKDAMHDTLFLLDVIYILAAAVFSVFIFKQLKLASILGYLIAGMVVGPYSIGLVSDVDAVRAIAEFGVVFLLFTIGLELPFERLKVLPPVMYGLGVAQIIVTAAIAALIAMLAGLPLETAIVVGATLSLSSTVFVVQLLLDRGELSTRLGRTAFAILLIQDLAVGPFLIVVTVLGDTSIPLGQALLLAGGKAVLALVVLFIVGRIVVRPLFRAAAITGNPDVFAGTTLLVVLATALITHSVGLSLALGGLLAGILLADTEYRHQVTAEIQPFRGLLLGLFFMAIGMSIDLGLAFNNFILVALLAIALIVGKATILSTIAFASGLPRRIAFPLGALLAQGGEFAFVLFGIAMIQGVVSKELGQILIVAIAITMLLSPLLATFSGMVTRRIAHSADIGYEQALESDIRLNGHVIIAGYGRVGSAIGARLRSQQASFIAVDLDPDRVKNAKQQGALVYFGDATRPEVLDALNIAEASAIVIALNNAKTALHLVGWLHYIIPDLPIYARAYDDEHAEALKRAGAQVVIPELVATGDRLANAILDAAKGYADT
jgi:CPA2 family monovalent cation:H+ antiporter-2